ncbi:MAG: S8 family serine peptidase [bacterium]|nr:S8 family serine peptidase [bacterium]
MIRIVLGVLALTTLLPVGYAAQPSSGYIVVLEKGADPAEIASTVTSLRLKRRDGVEPLLFERAVTGFAVNVGPGDYRALDALREHPAVAYVAEDRVLSIHAQAAQPGMQRIRVRGNASASVNDARDVDLDADIAILDTGVDSAHPDLIVHRSVDFVSTEASAGDPHGHGTHVAGVAAAIDDEHGIHGVAPGARLWSLRVVDSSGEAQTSDVLSALDYVIDHAAELEVVNLSFGGPGTDDHQCGAVSGDPLHQAICSVADAGVVVVVSAGNAPPYGRDTALQVPAAYDEVSTVSAVVETDGLGPGAGQGPPTIHGSDNSFAGTFSNYGFDVDIAAPGVDVVSTWPGGEYSTQSGTSVAAPHVAGAVALWIVKHGKPTDRVGVERVRDELVRTAFPQFGSDEGFSNDKEMFAEPLLDVSAIDRGQFDPVNVSLSPDKPVYLAGHDAEALIAVELIDAQGAALAGLPSNAFRAYLRGVQREVAVAELGGGQYDLALSVADLRPGDHDLTVIVRDLAGFERSAGCRIVLHAAAPGIAIHDYAFTWPVMNHDSFIDHNPLTVTLTDERGAPLLVPVDVLQTSFSAGGAGLSWSIPQPDYVTGVQPAVTYGSYLSRVDGIHALPLGTYHADLTVDHDGFAGVASASFEMAYNDPALTAGMSANLTSFDFTQAIEPPALDLTIEVTNEMQAGMGSLFLAPVDPLVLRIDGQSVEGTVFAEELLQPGTYRVHDVELASLQHGAHELVVHVSDARGLTATSNPVAIQLLQQAPAPCGSGSAPQADRDADGVADACDNCPDTPNPSQRDSFSWNSSDAGLGDACRARASLWVSSSAWDNADFGSIQAAVDAAPSAPHGVRIEVLPGSGPYVENLTLDRDTSYQILGRAGPAGAPVIRAADSGAPVIDVRSSGEAPVVMGHLVLRGAASAAGIAAGPGVDTRLSDLRLEQLAIGLALADGRHTVERIALDGSVTTGVRVDGGTLELSHGEFRGTQRAVHVQGVDAHAEIRNVLIVGDGAGDGVTNDAAPGSTLSLRHATIVGCGVAVRGNGPATAVEHSILWGNGSSVVDVSCFDIAWSDVEGTGCGGTNRALDPAFVDAAGGDYRLRATSPLLDHGPDPAGYTGDPCTDLAGAPRLRDHDGDGLAQIDPGAYETENASITPREVVGLIWSGKTSLVWQHDALAAEYHVYRGTLSELTYAAPSVCEDDLVVLQGAAQLTDPQLPTPGEAFHYQVTMEDTLGEESSLGVGTCAERRNSVPCP